MRGGLLTLLGLALAACQPNAPAPPSTLVIWAWERPEDLRFAGAEAEVAVQTGFVELSGEQVRDRGRHFPLEVERPPDTAIVHVEIDQSVPLAWTPRLRSRVVAAILHHARAFPARRVQVDFEVRASEREVLLEVLEDVRRGLPRTTLLSMTALASWCDTERWLDRAPVDEIVPMLFRMQEAGDALENRLAAGGDFRNPRCRSAFAVSTDTPVVRAPRGRRVYLFNPRSWTEADFRRVQAEVEGWG